MRAIVAAVVGVAIAAGAFALYRWLDEDEERARAEAATSELVGYFNRSSVASTGSKGRCEASALERLPDDDTWRFRLDCGQGTRCMAIDLEQFRVTGNDSVYVGGKVDGVTDARCAPELWTSQEAARRLEQSTWARSRKARFISCAGTDENRYMPYTNRFGCRYSSPRGEGYVVIRTTSAEAFEIESNE